MGSNIESRSAGGPPDGVAPCCAGKWPPGVSARLVNAVYKVGTFSGDFILHPVIVLNAKLELTLASGAASEARPPDATPAALAPPCASCCRCLAGARCLLPRLAQPSGRRPLAALWRDGTESWPAQPAALRLPSPAPRVRHTYA